MLEDCLWSQIWGSYLSQFSRDGLGFMGFKELCPCVPQNLVRDAEYCALVGYFVASTGNLVRNYHYSLLITQKSAILICLAVET